MTVFADVFYYEPWWMQIAKSLVIFFVVFNIVPMLLLAERKLLGRLQGRYGPNRVGPFGTVQALTDIGGLLGKQRCRPRTSRRPVHHGPVLSVVATVGAIAIIRSAPS